MDYVASRRVGDATITVVSEGVLPWAPELQAPEEEWRRAMPEADERGVLPLGLNVVHVQLGDASVVLDPGLDDPLSEWQRRYEQESPGLVRTPGLSAGLAAARIRPEEVTHVVISHSHKDHYCGVTAERAGNAPRFPNARHLLGRADWEGNPEREDPGSDLALRLGEIERLGLLELLDGQRDVAPGVTVIPAPGETPGHSVVRVLSGGEGFWYVGDLLHHPCEAEHTAWVSPGRDREAMRRSRERMLSEAAHTSAALVFTHAIPSPPWGRIARSGTGYRWERG